MYYHIILTERCDSQCRYCYGKSLKEFDNGLEEKFEFDFSAPCVSNVNVAKLKKFLQQDSKAVLIFYGGEPLMQIDKIKSIIKSLKDTSVRFMMQTNGKLLNLLPIEYLKNIEKILISLDGDKERTDKNRGKGTFEKVTSNIKQIKRFGYNGEIIARMTIAQDCPDLYDQVMNLINQGFNSIHWQLDVGFYKEDFEKIKIKKFLDEYNKNVTKLISWWIKEMSNGKVFKVYPFLGITESLLNKKKSKLRCGAGYEGYCITTDGKITACPIMNNIQNFIAGNLDTTIKDLKKFDVSGKCDSCEERHICGGRCLYWNQAKLWPKEGDDLICKSIKHLINQLRDKIPQIENQINSQQISLKNLEYEKYFGPEIIP